ncbi:hypothetical protein BOTBODRAFT_238432 [Botryobasidium botryosum FD-172 SS1]|uniref:Uncharacterized protein n=1 Tax=Botryobasidium botryosum (strain FD-172 SS1) TaxID=930990 RepID=A0A067MYT5_BOTB1|nr:hypothetical protein BOTBODRAFT_238432 [Botryobasidium botryosum FD-172 SS1]
MCWSCYPSYARPKAPFNTPPILIRNLLPLLTNNTPVLVAWPNLPSPLWPEALTSTHTLTTHVFPVFMFSVMYRSVQIPLRTLLT